MSLASRLSELITAIGADIKSLRSLPVKNKTAAYTLVAADNSNAISITTGGVTIPANIFAAGNNVVIYNNSATAQTITCSAVTAYITGNGTVKTSVSLAARGMCTVWFYAANAVAVAGDVS
jgi:F0F1-type ATP synthase alpha subunit